MVIALAAASALFYGLGDFSGGYAAGKSKVLSVLVVSQACGLLTALLAIAFTRPGAPGAADLVWGLTGGVAGAFGIVTLYRGIAKGVVAIVSPTAALVSAVLPIAVGLALGDEPGALAFVGMGLCVPAVVLLSLGPKGGESGRGGVKASLVHGLIAGLGFGLFYVALSRPGVGSGFWPLVAARLASITVAIVVMLARRERLVVNRGGRIAAMLAGVLDMAANFLFVLASGAGMLSIVAVIVSLYPAPTVLMARLVFKERFGPVRILGLLLTLAGLALISLR